MDEVTEQPARGGRMALLSGALTAAAYAALGVAFYAYSGAAEGVVGPRVFLLLGAVSGLPLAAWAALAFLFRLRRPRTGNRWLMLGGVALCYLLVWAGYRLDDSRMGETMARGDLLAKALEDHKGATGAYPASLAALDGATPLPALDNSAFFYGPTDDGGYAIAFPAPALLLCRRTAANPYWECDDR